MTERQDDLYSISKGKTGRPVPFLNKATFTLMTIIVMFAAGGYVLNGDELPDWVGILMAFGPIAFVIVYTVLPKSE